MTSDEHLRQQLAEAQHTIRKLQEDLTETNSGFIALTLEFEQRVDERTAALQEVNRQLEHEIAERKRAEEVLKATVAELERFAYIASHDLQEPLRMVSSYTQLLARRYQGQLGADADDYIAYAVEGAQRMHDLINDLLTYSQLITRSRPFKPTACDKVLDRVLSGMGPVIEESSAVITRDPLPTVMADGAQLTQLFQNLIGNAIKFRSDQPPHIHISAERLAAPESEAPGEGNGEDRWLFSVRDNGIGIEPQYHERIFLIFQRLHSTEEYPGTGAGLAICRRIVERHDGRIWVESEAGDGATFYFTIPMLQLPGDGVLNLFGTPLPEGTYPNY